MVRGARRGPRTTTFTLEVGYAREAEDLATNLSALRAGRTKCLLHGRVLPNGVLHRPPAVASTPTATAGATPTRTPTATATPASGGGSGCVNVPTFAICATYASGAKVLFN